MKVCFSPSSNIVKKLSKKIDFSQKIIAAKLQTFVKNNNINIENINDNALEEAFVQDLYKTFKNPKYKIREVTTNDIDKEKNNTFEISKEVSNAANNIVELATTIDKAKESGEKLYIIPAATKEANNLMLEVLKDPLLPDNIILPYELESRAIVERTETPQQKLIRETALFHKEMDAYTRDSRIHMIADMFSRVLDLLQEKNPLVTNRIDLIKSQGTSNIFSDVYDSIIEMSQNEDLDESKRNKYALTAKYFDELVGLSIPIINFREQVKLTPNGTMSSIKTDKSSSINLFNTKDNEDDVEASEIAEEALKDRWMMEVTETSAKNSLSTETRRLLSAIPNVNYKGEVETNDLDRVSTVDADYAHSILIDGLKNMLEPEEMLDKYLPELVVAHPWVQGVINMLTLSPEMSEKEKNKVIRFRTKFWTDFRKDFASFYVEKKSTQDGQSIYKSIAINSGRGIKYLLSSWKDTLDSNTILTNKSVYTKEGFLDRSNIKENVKILRTLNSSIRKVIRESKSGDERTNNIRIEAEQHLQEVSTLFKSIGIQIDNENLQQLLEYSPSKQLLPQYKAILETLSTIYSVLSSTQDKINVKTNEKEKMDLMNLLKTQYKNMANFLSPFTDESIENSVHQGDKSYYSFLVPNYTEKTVKYLKNVASKSVEAYKNWIHENFGKSYFFKSGGQYRNEWLRLLTLEDRNGTDLGEEYRKMLDTNIVLTFDGKEFTDWTDNDQSTVFINEYFFDPNKKTARYPMPPMADAPIAKFIKFIRFTNGSRIDTTGKALDYEDAILEQLEKVVHQELDRIKVSKAMTGSNKIKNFSDKGGQRFRFVPEMNQHLDEINKMIENGKDAYEIRNFIKDKLEEILDKKFASAVQDWKANGLLDQVTDPKGNPTGILENLLGADFSKLGSKAYEIVTNTNSTKDNLGRRNNNLNPLKEYFFNNYFAASQIIQLFTTDLAFYPSIEDFQKRFKEVNAPGLRLDTSIPDGKKFEKTIILKDELKASSIFDLKELTECLDSTIEAGNIDEIGKANILSHYGAFNAKIYTNKDNHIYKHIINNEKDSGKYFKDDKEITKQTYDKTIKGNEKSEKEVYYVDDKNFKGQSFLTQKVNVTDAQAFRTMKSFRSILKMSGQWSEADEESLKRIEDGTWNINDFNIAWQTLKPFLYTQTMVDSGVTINGERAYNKVPMQNKNSEFPLLMYGLLTHSERLKGLSQFMDTNDIDVAQFESAVKVGNQGVIDINDLKTAEQINNHLLKFVNDPNYVHSLDYDDYAIQQNIPTHYQDSTQVQGTQLRVLTAADISDNANISLNIKGTKINFNKGQWLQTYNKLITENVLDTYQDTLNLFKDPKELSIILQEAIKSRKGVNQDLTYAVQTDAKGEFLVPLFEGSQSTRIQNMLNSVIKSRITKQRSSGGSLVQVSGFGFSDELHVVYEGKGKNKHIKHWECYMPWYSKKALEYLIDPKTGLLDINRVPKKLKNLIGYRIPTEDKYSMAPLYIKGFLPQRCGGVIMLPNEVTTIVGSDFDIDKMYIMTPEFNYTENFDKEAFIRDIYKNRTDDRTREEYEKEIDDVLNKIDNNEEFDEDSEEMKTFDYYQDHKSEYLKGKFNKITLKSFDNKDIETKTDEEGNLLNSSYQTKARNNAMLDMVWSILTHPDTVSKMMNPGGFEHLKDVVKDYKAKETSDADILSPRTQVQIHGQNMVAKALIGIIALHNTSHAKLQHLNAHLSKANTFVLDGKTYTLLDKVKAPDGSYISKNLAEFLAASVDAIKDPVLKFMNLNSFTIDSAMLLTRLGYKAEAIAPLLNHPAIKYATDLYFKNIITGNSKADNILEAINNYSQLRKEQIDLSTDYDTNTFNGEALKKAALTDPTFDELKNMNPDQRDSIINEHLQVLMLFSQICNDADVLSKVTAAMRADSLKGGATPTIAGNLNRIMAIKDCNESLHPHYFGDVEVSPVIEGLENVLNYEDQINNYEEGHGPDTFFKDINNLRDYIDNSSTPLVTAFTLCGLEATEELLKPYFPFYNKDFKDLMGLFRDYTKDGRLSDKTLESILEDSITYLASGSSFFKGKYENTEYSKPDYYINHFPEDFNILKSNPNFSKNSLISKLNVVPIRGTEMKKIIFSNVGGLSDIQRTQVMEGWADLLAGDETAHKLAIDLFMYNYFRNGFSFGPESFMHLASTSVILSIPGYLETLKSIMNNSDDGKINFVSYFEQYLLNNLTNRKFTPLVNDSNDSISKAPNGSITIDSNHLSSTTKKFLRTLDSPYLTVGIKGSKGITYYYLKDFTRFSDESFKGQYVEVEPLGITHEFKRYEYNKQGLEVNNYMKKANVIAQNTAEDNVDTVPDEDDKQGPTVQDGQVSKTIKDNKKISIFDLSDTDMPSSPYEDTDSKSTVDKQSGKPLC